tara:strand:- start:1219 stop:1488 length:270 start_codon:yes stop_codon:yes gene_type:complete
MNIKGYIENKKQIHKQLAEQIIGSKDYHVGAVDELERLSIYIEEEEAMELEKAVQILKEYNIWRRGADTEHTDPKTLGEAIDTILNYFD